MNTQTRINLKTGTIELGPLLQDGEGHQEIGWFAIQRELSRLNDSLPDEEQPWRAPTKQELEEIGAGVFEIRAAAPENEREAKTKEYFEGMGFAQYEQYYSVTDGETEEHPNYGCFLSTHDGKLAYRERDLKLLVRCVRSVE